MHKNTKNNFSNLDKLSHEIYSDNKFARKYSENIETNLINSFYEKPTTISLLNIVEGMKVLDAGCGSGVYTEWLIQKGADVTAVDYSKEMLSIAKEKNLPAKFIEANLNYPLDFFEDEKFDLILCPLVIHYIKDLNLLFSEFNRILKPSGIFVFSTHHPFLDQKIHPETNYYKTELIEDRWTSYNVLMKTFKRPLSEIFRLLKINGFRTEDLLEPLPPEIMKENDPDLYYDIISLPRFIFLKAVKIY